MELARSATLVAAIVAMGLMAGLFCAYAYSVMPGLARTDDRTLAVAMRSINRAILNGWFFAGYVGAVVLTAVTGVLHLIDGAPTATVAWIAAAFVLYVVVLGITARINVPLNNRLDASADPARDPDFAAARAAFEAPWVRWNVVRTVTSTLAFACLVMAR